MWRNNRLLVMANIFSLLILILTVYHHFTVKQLLKEMEGNPYK